MPKEAVSREAVPRVEKGETGLDWATLLPAACAIHCTITPLLAVALPVLALSHKLEWLLLASAVVLAGISLRITWPTHRRVGVLVMAFSGLAVWAAAVLGWLAPLPEPVMSPLGGLTLAGALFWNGRLRHEAACNDCGCGMHG
jgi:MerC mercury resistance protein